MTATCAMLSTRLRYYRVLLQAAVQAAEGAVNAAQDAATKVLGAEENDEDGAAVRPPPQAVMDDDELYELESAVKKARIAGNCVSQVTKRNGVGAALSSCC